MYNGIRKSAFHGTDFFLKSPLFEFMPMKLIYVLHSQSSPAMSQRALKMFY